ncbi:zinc metalloprotease [Aspergillus stella-maris]|uniref:zinc metalloprotease n=1 Tax=Aspergillus stella-maris TaxID=1810926 RepID=UPI003CCD180B
MLFSRSAYFLLALFGAVSASWCGAPVLSEAGLAVHRKFRAQEAAAAAARNASSLRARQVDGMQIPVYFHLFRQSESESAVLAYQVRQQVDMLNRYFRPAGYSFDLAGIESQIVPDLGPVWLGTAADRQIKESRVGDLQTLNFYVVPNIVNNFAGYATFPWWSLQQPQLDGVVMKRDNIPGGRAVGFNTGKIGVHETGHWLGLLHTFEGGCDQGDQVDDTPAEAGPAYGCPIISDSCPQPGNDPIHNHMDYTNDACRWEFTSGQVQRMYSMYTEYRLPPLGDGGTGEPEPLPEPRF